MDGQIAPKKDAYPNQPVQMPGCLAGNHTGSRYLLFLMLKWLNIRVLDAGFPFHLVGSANFNKGTNKIYLGVAGNLFAFACKLSFENGYEGYVAFDSKSALIDHYKKKLGATHFKGQRMYIETVNALKLVKKYFQD